MRSTGKRRPRNRKQIPWALWLWLAFGVNVFLGLNYSQLTQASKIRVAGNSTGIEPEVRKALAQVEGRPARQVNLAAVEAAVLEAPIVQSVTYTQTVFGRGLLTIKQKKVVANIETTGDEVKLTRGLGADGSIFALPSPRPDLPTARIPSKLLHPGMMLVSAWESQRLAEFCSDLKDLFPVSAWTVEVDERAVISLKGTAKGRVVLGNSEKLQEKLKKLQQILAADPQILSNNRELNLMVADQPVLTK